MYRLIPAAKTDQHTNLAAFGFIGIQQGAHTIGEREPGHIQAWNGVLGHQLSRCTQFGQRGKANIVLGQARRSVCRHRYIQGRQGAIIRVGYRDG